MLVVNVLLEFSFSYDIGQSGLDGILEIETSLFLEPTTMIITYDVQKICIDMISIILLLL